MPTSSRPDTYHGLTIASGIHVNGRSRPNKIALCVSGRTRSYRELSMQIRRVAARANAYEHDADSRIAGLLAPNCLEFAEVVCGLAEAGYVTATINPRVTATELSALADDCRPRLMFVHPTLAGLVREAKLSTLDEIVVLDDSYQEWLAQARRERPLPAVAETDPFALVYTSGTTGTPKGVLLSHRSRILTFFGMAMEYGCFGPDDVHLALAPMAHGAGFAFTLAPLYFGSTVHVLERFDPERVLHELEASAATGTFMVPTHYHAIFELGGATLERYRATTPSLRAIISNASALPQATKRQIVDYWGDGLLHETYGSTEGGVVTNLRPDQQLTRERCVGLPFALTEVRLLDASGSPVERGEIGELYSRSPYLFNGYFGRDDETAACLRDGWLTVGDLARQDEDGYVYIVDRKKDMVVSGGINIYPREVEERLHQHPDVIEAAVIGVPDDKWGEALSAFVVVGNPAAADAAALETFCRQTLSGYKVPKSITFIERLPRNAGGKVLKNELRQ